MRSGSGCEVTRSTVEANTSSESRMRLILSSMSSCPPRARPLGRTLSRSKSHSTLGDNASSVLPGRAPQFLFAPNRVARGEELLHDLVRQRTLLLPRRSQPIRGQLAKGTEGVMRVRTASSGFPLRGFSGRAACISCAVPTLPRGMDDNVGDCPAGRWITPAQRPGNRLLLAL